MARYDINVPSALPGFQAFDRALDTRLGFEREKAAAGAEKQLHEQAAQVFKTGTDEEMAEFMIKNPSLAQDMNKADAFLSDRTKQNAIDSAWDVVTGKKPPSAAYIERAQMVQKEGGDPNRTLTIAEESQKNPDVGLRDAKVTLLRLDRDAYTAYKEDVSGGADDAGKGTANIKDWRHYRKLLAESPEQASQFARQVGITETAEPELKPTVPMQNLDRWRSMPEGAEKRAFATMIGISPKDTPEEARKKLAASAAIQTELNTADETLASIDTLLNTEGYIDSLTGVRGATPFSVPGGVGYDANVAFEQFKDSLTLENMSKMTGILSDSDIKILRSAAAGLTAGMSKKAFIRKLEEIKARIIKKAKGTRARAGTPAQEPSGETPTIVSQADYDNLPSGTIFIEDGQKYRKP